MVAAIFPLVGKVAAVVEMVVGTVAGMVVETAILVETAIPAETAGMD